MMFSSPPFIRQSAEEEDAMYSSMTPRAKNAYIAAAVVALLLIAACFFMFLSMDDIGRCDIFCDTNKQLVPKGPWQTGGWCCQ